MRSDRGYRWLLLGGVLAAAGLHGRWTVGVAAWLYPLVLLRGVRTTGPVAGPAGVFVAMTLAGAAWLAEGGLPPFGPFLAFVAAENVVLTLPYVADRRLARRLAGHAPLASTLVFPLTWVLAETALRRFSPIGDIYGTLSATQHGDLPLLQLASVTGGTGISFLVAWVASVGNLVWEREVPPRRIRAVVAVVAAVLLTTFTLGGLRLALAGPGSPTVRVAGVAPDRASAERLSRLTAPYNSPQEIVSASPPGLREAVTAVNDDLVRATEREARAGARLVVWPEFGAQALADDAPALLDRVADVARSTGAHVLVGLATYSPRAPYGSNQAILVDPSGAVRWRYDKAHPIPGAEHYPAGPRRVPVADTPFGRLSTMICFDADFPALARQGGRKGVDIMLLPASDWFEFGRTHSEQVTLRAVENGHALVRQDTPGLSQVVDARGRVLASSDYYGTSRQAVVAEVPVRGTRTLYARTGDVFPVGCLLALVVLTGRALTGRRSSAGPGDGGHASRRVTGRSAVTRSRP